MNDLIHRYVILKPDYWDLNLNGNERFQGYRLTPNGTAEPALLRMPDLDFISIGNVIKHTPRVGYVTNIQNFEIEGQTVRRAIVQTSFYFPRYRHGDYELIDPSWLTTFKVVLRPDANVDEEGCLGNASEFKLGEIIEDTTDPDNNSFVIHELKSRLESEYNTHDLLFLPDAMYEALQTAVPLTLVSKTGFLPPELPNNIQHVILSQLSGMPSRYTPQTIVRNIQSWLYGPPQTIVQEPEPNVNALNNGPLPYGPSEENFAGGKRKKTRKSKKAKRKTRKSK